ncbi:MAG: class I SAM-dependent methyltransferase [Devosia sp.]
MTQARRLRPEKLDILPHDHPDALRSRSDIVRLNGLMGQARVADATLEKAGVPAPRRILDLGAGCGRTTLALAKRLHRRGWTDVEITLVDRLVGLTQETEAAFAMLGWTARPVVADADAFLADHEGPPFDIVWTNLFLHHLEEDLPKLLAAIGPVARCFLATEPRRATTPHALSHFVGVVGANAVTRYDAVASVEAGFAGKELTALWPYGDDWSLTERYAFPFMHVFCAVRRA